LEGKRDDGLEVDVDDVLGRSFEIDAKIGVEAERMMSSEMKFTFKFW
jgi:hypothetical protein